MTSSFTSVFSVLYPVCSSRKLTLGRSGAFKQQRQLVFGTLDKQDDLSYAIRQVIQDVKSAEGECTALELGLAPLRRACDQLASKVRSEEEDLQRLADIWGSYRPTDGRPSSLRAGALRDFRKQSVPFPSHVNHPFPFPIHTIRKRVKVKILS